MTNRSKKPYSISEWAFAIIFTLIGAGAFIMGAKFFHERLTLESNGLTAEAIIIDVKKVITTSHGHRRVRRSTTHYCPVVRFTDNMGNTHTGESKVMSNEYKNLQKGRTITITYLPEKPTEIILAGDSTGKSGPVAFMVVGGLFCTIGGFLIYKGFKK